MKKIVPLILCLVISVPCFAQQTVENPDKEAEAIRDFLDLSGISVTIDNEYIKAAQKLASNMESTIKPDPDNPISDTEKQDLIIFFYNKLKKMTPYSDIENNTLIPMYEKNFTYEEIMKMINFMKTSEGKRILEFNHSNFADNKADLLSGKFVSEFNQKYMGPENIKETQAELVKEFPEWLDFITANPPADNN